MRMIINGDAKGHLIYYNSTCLWKLRLWILRLYSLTPNPFLFKYMEKLMQPSLLCVCVCVRVYAYIYNRHIPCTVYSNSFFSGMRIVVEVIRTYIHSGITAVAVVWWQYSRYRSWRRRLTLNDTVRSYQFPNVLLITKPDCQLVGYSYVNRSRNNMHIHTNTLIH